MGYIDADDGIIEGVRETGEFGAHSEFTAALPQAPTLYFSQPNNRPTSVVANSNVTFDIQTVKIALQSLTAKLPTKAHKGDLGYDLYSDETVWIWPFQRKLISTGIAFASINTGFGGIIKDRSSIAWKRGLFTHAGVIDSGYRGEIKVLMYNSTLLPKKIEAGEKIAQMVIVPVINGTVEEGYETVETTRGNNGFGSTGR